MKRIYAKVFLSAAVLALVLNACKKKEYDIFVPPLQAHFANTSSGNYFVTAPGVTYKIPIGVTTISAVPRTINISITSPSGAVAGTHYNLSKTNFVIGAGQALDSLVVTGVFSQYQAGRKDTLIFAIRASDGVAPSDYNDTFRLYMRGPCFEGEINTDFAALAGNYASTNETFGTSPYGPYVTRIKSITKTGATTANVVIGNIFDDGWGDLTFTMDWTDINNRKVTLVEQNTGKDASSVFGATYAGQPLGVRPVPGGTTVGTFSFCGQTLSAKMQLGIFGTGLWSGTLYTVNLAR